MEQYKIVEAVSEKIIAEKTCEAIFLKGEIARQEHDQYSDIDLYVLVSKQNFDRFLEYRLSYLEAYQPLLHYQFSLSIYPLVIGVYENGYRINLYAVSESDKIQAGAMLVIYDPKKILSEFEKISLSYSADEIKEELESFCLNAKDYFVACKRRDQIYSFSLATALFQSFASLFRIGFDAENAKMGVKNFLKKSDYETRRVLKEILSKLNYEFHPDAVKLMFVALDSLLGTFPLKIVENVNFDFYNHTKNLIMSIN